MSDERATNEIDQRLGQRVRARRLQIGMSQEGLADLLGVTFQQVQKYEKGVNRIAASRLFDFAAALDVSVARFFEGLAPRGASGVAHEDEGLVQDALSTPLGIQLAVLFASIKSVKTRRRVLDLIRA